MKNNWLILGLLPLLLAPQFLAAQTITLGPITKTVYCVGDTMVVPYTASGTFKADNFFCVHLSTPGGSFTSFTLAGHNIGLTGQLTIPLPVQGTGYRVRIASSSPYLTSLDNGKDIAALLIPHPDPLAYPPGGSYPFRDLTEGFVLPVGFAGQAVNIIANAGAGLSYKWDFSEDANMQNSTDSAPRVIYSREGVKNVSITLTNLAGCDTTYHFRYYIMGCSPTIPSSARIVTDNTGGNDSVVWVKPGGTFIATGAAPGGSTQVVFVEPGGSAIPGGFTIFYLKGGSSFGGGNAGASTTVQVTGATGGKNPFFCSDLTFDYSQVSGSVNDTHDGSISMTQNSDHLRITDDQPSTTCRIFSLLGTELLSQRGAGALDVDLTPLPAGMYFAIMQAGDERVVRKIVVAH